MCGIAGLIAGKQFPFSLQQLEAMTAPIRHRGPDSFGHWHKDGAFLGHRRLAIVDLTEAGHQPMLSKNGRYALTYNGEIYNHLDIRAALDAEEQISWRGHSDTETLVEALSRWGTRKTLDRVNGMFAFGLWDMQTRSLTLARDPFGEKPLLYALQGHTFAFASELSAIRSVAAFRTAPDPVAVSQYLNKWLVPSPHVIVHGIRKLPPGCYLEWQVGRDLQITNYWSMADVALKGRRNMVQNERDAIDELEALLVDAVKIRMMSDVPLGALLSGGVDSSLIVALMQKSQTAPVRTFTIGFAEAEVDESAHAEAVAAYLGTTHTTMRLEEADVLSAVPKMGEIFDEPFADASQVPTYLVSKLARQHVTVTLTGDGCDELFSGYARHVLAEKAWNSINRIPFRKQLAPHISKVPDAALKLVAKLLSPLIPAGVNPESLGRKLKYSGSLLSVNSADEIYQSYMTSFEDPTSLLAKSSGAMRSGPPQYPPFDNPHDKYVWQDSVDYLPNDILTKVDRASMAVSLEGRIPPLDRRIAEFAWRLPQHMRWRDGKGKWALREVLYRHVPQALIDRPKRGFAVPLERWLRGPLKPWCMDVLARSRIEKHGILNAQAVAGHVADFQSGGVTTATQIWTLLMLQSWMDNNLA
jgi:asparagine synthase (glutamine-hydrolysing)